MAHRTKRRLRIVLLAVAAVAVVGTLVLRSRTAWDGACTLLRRELPELLGVDIGINRCELNPLTQTVTLRGVSAFAKGSDEPFFVADEASATLRSVWLPGSLELGRVSLTKPRVRLDLRAPSTTPSGASTCSAEWLKRVQVHSLEIRGAEVKALLPSATVEVRDIDLEWSVRRGLAEFRLDSRGGTVSLPRGAELVLSKLSVDGALDAREESVEVTRGELALDEGTLSLSGRIDAFCRPRLALDAQVFLPLAAVARVSGSRASAGGQLWSRVSVNGPASAPSAQLDLIGSRLFWGEYHPGDFSAHLALAGDDVTMTSFATPAGNGAIRATGQLKLAKDLPVKLQFDVERAQFARVLERVGLTGAWIDFPATGRVTASGRLLPFPSLNGEAELETGKLVVTSAPFDAPFDPNKQILTFPKGRAQLRVAVHRDRVELLDAKLEAGRSRALANAALYFDLKRGLSIQANAEHLELDDFGHIAGLKWSGRGNGTFSLEGPYADVRIESAVSLKDFVLDAYALGAVQGTIGFSGEVLKFSNVVAQKGRSHLSGTSELRFPSKGGVRWGLNVSMPKGRAEDVIDIVVGLHPGFELFQGTLSGAVSGGLQLDGPMGGLAGRLALDVKDGRYYERRLGDGRLALRFEDGERMVLEPAVLKGPLGTLAVRGSYSFDGPIAYTFRLDAGSLRELVGPQRADELGVSGELTLVGKAEGDSTTPVVNAYLTSPRVTFARRALGAMHLEGHIVGRDFQLWGRPFDDAKATIKVKLKEPYNYEGSASLALPDIGPLLPKSAVSQGLSGAIAGTVSAAGSFSDAKTARASAQVDKLSLSRGDFVGQSEGPIRLSYRDGRLELDSLSFRGPNTELSASGFWGPSTVDIKLKGGVDARLVESFTPVVERTGGRVELVASASGALTNPTLVGSAELMDVRGALKDQPFAVRSVSGRVFFSDSRVLLQDIVGILNEGRVSVRGDLRLQEFAVKQVEIGLDLDEVVLRAMEDLPVTVTGPLLLYGAPGKLQLSGGLDIVKLRYEKPLALESFVKTVRGERGGGSPDAASEWLKLDVDLSASGDVRVENNIARAKLLGKVKLTGTNVRPGLVGTVETAEGSQAFYRGSQFEIARGAIQFRDRNGFDGTVDFNAQTRVRAPSQTRRRGESSSLSGTAEYLVTVRAFGRMSDFKVLFTSDPSLSEADIVSLLTLGVTRESDASYSAEAGAGLAAEALLSASGVDRQFQRFLPKNPLLKDLQVHLSTTYNEATGIVEPAWSLESKLLTEKLKLGMTQPVLGRGRRAQAEYRFTDRFSARAQWDNDNGDTSLGNLGLDLKWRFEVE